MDQIPVLHIENKPLYREFIKDIKLLENNKAERLHLLYDDEKEVKHIHLIEAPVSLEFNNSKTSRYLTNLLNDAFNEEYELRIEIENYLRKVIFDLYSDTNLQIELAEQMDLKQLIKLFQIKIVDDSENDIGSLINYVELINAIDSNVIFIFMDIKKYFFDDELIELYKYCSQNEIEILILGSSNNKLPQEKLFIIDKDLCEIF